MEGKGKKGNVIGNDIIGVTIPRLFVLIDAARLLYPPQEKKKIRKWRDKIFRVWIDF